MSNVLYIKSISDQELIETLAHWLDLARSGELKGIVAVAEESRELTRLWSKTDAASAIGYCEMMKHKILQQWLG